MRWLLTFCLTAFGLLFLAAFAVGIALRGSTPDPDFRLSADGRTRIVDCSRRLAAAPFRCGDLIDQQRLPLPEIVRWWQSPLYTKQVAYADRHPDVTESTIVYADPTRERLDSKLVDAADCINKVLLMSLGILIIAKGRDTTSYLAALFLYGLAAGSGINVSLVGVPFWTVIAVHAVRQIFLATALYCLFALAVHLTSFALPAPLRKLLSVLAAGLNLLVILPLLLYVSVCLPLFAVIPDAKVLALFYGLPVLAKLFPLAIIGYGITRADAPNLDLLRGIFAWTIIGLSGPLVKETSSALGVHDGKLGVLILTDSVMAFGYAYVIIRNRVVRLNFYLSRAAILSSFGLVLTIVMLRFEDSLAEFNFSRSQTIEGWFYRFVLSLAMLGLGMSLRFIEPKLDSLFDRIAFNRQYRIGRGLRTLYRDCEAITDPHELTALASAQLRRLVAFRRVAIYERTARGFTVVTVDAESAEGLAPFEPLPIDDQAVLRIMSTLEPTGDRDLKTNLPADCIALPMVVGGRVIGAFVCERRPAGTYDNPDVRKLVARFVCRIGLMLVFLRSRYGGRPLVSVRSDDDSARASAFLERADGNLRFEYE